MSTINMLSLWQWAVLAAIPPTILLLYFLKLKRTPLEVPSTYLWHKSIEDLHVNSIWQRLRTSILLLLQLLLVLVAILALLRPGWSGSQLSGHRFVFLVDTSASMSSKDVTPSRLEEAKRRVGELIDQMDSGDVAMIVSFSDVARVEQAFTDDRRELRRQLEAIEPTNRPTRLDEALRVVAGLAGFGNRNEESQAPDPEAPPAALYLFSDGRFPDVADFSLARLSPVFVPIGEHQPPNVGITAFSTRRQEDKREHLQAFGRIENFGPEAITTDVELLRDNTLVDAKQIQLDPHASSGVVFNLGEVPSGTLELRARSGGMLAVDDRAWTAVDPLLRAHVLLVTPGNDALEFAMQTEGTAEIADVEVAGPDFLTSPKYLERAAGGYYALIVYDQCQPRELPQADTLLIGRLPPGGVWKVDARIEGPEIVDVDTTHPLMHLIDLSNVKFAEANVLKPPVGATILVSTDKGPLLAIAPRDGFEDAVLGAEIVGTNEQAERYANSDWPLRLSFPVFILNTLSYFSDVSNAGVMSLQPGTPAVLRSLGTSEQCVVKTPGGQAVMLHRQGGEAFVFNGTSALGVYAVEEPEQPVRHFAVNLFDSAESTIDPRRDVEIGHTSVEGESTWQGARHELWRPLLLGALGVLCLEWYIYNRRVIL